MLTVAVGWELYERTHSLLSLCFVGLVEMVAMLCCTLPAGHLADNLNRKLIILTALTVSACASLGLAAHLVDSMRPRRLDLRSACSPPPPPAPFSGPPARRF